MLVGLVDQAARGRGGLVVLEGPAGIGKTRLLAAGQELGAERGMTVVKARGGSLEQDFAFGAVRQLLEPLVLAPDAPTDLFAGAAASAASVLDGGAAPVTVDGSAVPPGEVLHGLFWLTAALAERRPLLVVCDDAHWFDGPSLRFVAYLSRRVDDLPIAVLMATRPPEPGPDGELLSRVISDQGVVRVRPAPLDRKSVV